MNIAIRFIFLLLPIFITPQFSHAQVGTLQEVIAAANAKKHPTYIKPLMEQLSAELNKFVKTQKIQSPEQKLAWFVTMRMVLEDFYFSNLDVTNKVTSDGNAIAERTRFALAIRSVREAEAKLQLRSYQHPWSIKLTHSQSLDKARWEAMNDDSINSLSRGEQRKIVWSVVEWTTLNFLLQNIASLLETYYQPMLDSLKDFPLHLNPFRDDNESKLFLQKHFGARGIDVSEGMLFLAPWFAQIITADQAPVHGGSAEPSRR